MILESGADPNLIARDDRQTGLLLARQKYNMNTAKTLIAAGANTNPTLQFGRERTPLQLAVEKGSTDSVNLLLEVVLMSTLQHSTEMVPLHFSLQLSGDSLALLNS